MVRCTEIRHWGPDETVRIGELDCSIEPGGHGWPMAFLIYEGADGNWVKACPFEKSDVDFRVSVLRQGWFEIARSARRNKKFEMLAEMEVIETLDVPGFGSFKVWMPSPPFDGSPR